MLTVKKQILPNKTFLTNFAMQTIILIILFVSNIFSQVVIEERIEIDPTNYKTNIQTTRGDGWWIDTCYINTYDSSEVDLTFSPPAIEPGETTIMTVDYNEELHNFLDRNITLEPNLGSIIKTGNSEYKYYAPSSTPGDTALIVRIYYEQFHWGCAYGELKPDSIKTNSTLEDYQCGCPIWTWTQVFRKYGIDSIIIAWDSLDVKVVPDTIYPGDTAQVVIKKRLPDGTLIDFVSTQTYVAGMLDGCILGKLVAGVQEGAYVEDVLQPIYFIADTSADTTGSVLLRVGLVELTDKPQIKNSQQTDLVESDCFIGGQFGNYDNVTVVKEHPIEIIYPTSNSPDEWITSEPAMPEISYAVELHSHIGQQVKLICEYEVSCTYQRRSPEGYPICSRTSKVIYHDTLDAEGGVINVNPVIFTKDKATFEFKARGHRGSGCNETITTWDEGDDVFTGGSVTIRVTATDLSWDAFAFREQVANRILGINPDTQAIDEYANSNEIKAILFVEAKTNQFTGEGIDPSMWWPYDEPGFPLYGAPNGYGLMQLDNSLVATEKQLWNWKANIDGGTNKYNNLKSIALNRIKKHPYTEEVLLKCAFQLYHSYEMYYEWTKSKGWQPIEGVAHNYGYQAYKKYLELNN